MKSSYDPWADIPVAPIGRFSRRRLDVETPHELFWFRDEMNHPGLLIEISRDIPPASLREAKISIRDIAVDVVESASEGVRALIIRLEEEQNRDVFLKLCLDLIERVTIGDATQDTFGVVCRRLKKWQSLLSGKSKNLLSSNEKQGLYAELFFIGEMLARDVSCEVALLKGWEGPDRTQQDFILDDMAVEIKSIAGNQRGKVRISSEDQLDTHLSSLYLRVYFLSEMQDNRSAESLNEIVRRIASQLTRRESRELFELKLEAARYIDIPDYDTPFFRVKDCRTYLVSEGFPCITRRILSEGAEAVSYDLVLASIDKFRTDALEKL